ncbi:hypothetical protein ACWGJ2_12290 [Streptomyces sp. NPDC054796]
MSEEAFTARYYRYEEAGEQRCSSLLEAVRYLRQHYERGDLFPRDIVDGDDTVVLSGHALRRAMDHARSLIPRQRQE